MSWSRRPKKRLDLVKRLEAAGFEVNRERGPHGEHIYRIETLAELRLREAETDMKAKRAEASELWYACGCP